MKFGTVRIIGLGCLMFSAASSAGAYEERAHLLNAQNHLTQALRALDSAAYQADPALRFRFETVHSKAKIQQILEGIELYLQAPLQPQISPEIYQKLEEGRK